MFERRIILNTLYRELDVAVMEIAWEVYHLLPEDRDRFGYKGLSGQKAYNRLLKDISFVNHLWGGHISQTAEEMVSRAEKYQVRTYTYFNGVYLVCEPSKDTVESLVDLFDQKSVKNAEKFERTFRYKLDQREMEECWKEAEGRRKIVEGWMEEEKMNVKFFKILKYRRIKKEVQVEPYSARIVTLAEEWAVGMQRAMREGKKVTEISENIEDFVDYDFLTGYMHGCAASFIAQFWKHGQKFRKWYNLSNQIGDEGEKANKKRNAILNPAILLISVGGD